jgi:hypothetical protein
VAGFIEPSKAEAMAGAQAGQKGAGGFIDIPGGTFSPVADSDVSYLADARIWLPVSPQSIAPDRKSYVVGHSPRESLGPPTTTLVVVDVKTKQERVLFTPPAGNFAYPLAYTAAGVYVELGASQPTPGQGSAYGLVLLDPSTGKQTPLPGADNREAGVMYQAWLAVAGGAAWGMVGAGTPSQFSYQLVRWSLSDGSRVVWYDGAFGLIGFDWNDHPILQIGAQSSPDVNSTKVVVVPAPKQAVPIEIKGGSFLLSRGQPVKDAHGVWFGSSDGSIWLLTPDGQFTNVATVPPQAGGSGQPYDPHAWRSIAGPCI